VQHAAVVQSLQARGHLTHHLDGLRRHHVRRLHPAQEPALLDEARAHVVVVGPVVREHLDRDRGVELLVVGEPHRREATGADAAAHGVATETVGHATR
jgi:hypothetical protein